MTVIIDRFDNGAEEEEESGFLRWGITWFKKVDASVGFNGPVVMLAASVDARERFFMQQAHEPVL